MCLYRSAPSAIGTVGVGSQSQTGFELTDFVFVLNDRHGRQDLCANWVSESWWQCLFHRRTRWPQCGRSGSRVSKFQPEGAFGNTHGLDRFLRSKHTKLIASCRLTAGFIAVCNKGCLSSPPLTISHASALSHPSRLQIFSRHGRSFREKAPSIRTHYKAPIRSVTQRSRKGLEAQSQTWLFSALIGWCVIAVARRVFHAIVLRACSAPVREDVRTNSV